MAATGINITKIANGLAAKAGLGTWKDVSVPVNGGTKTLSPGAFGVVSDLVGLVLNQNIIPSVLKNGSPYMLFEIFTGERFIGNSFSYVFPLMTGISNYSDLPNVPITKIEPRQESALVNFFTPGTNNLANGTYQSVKEITINKPEADFAFINGNMDKYIAAQIQSVAEVAIYSIYQNIMGAIKATKMKEVVGTATNMFDIITLELYPELMKFQQLTSVYNFANADPAKPNESAYLKRTIKDDIIFIMSRKTKVIWEKAMLSNIYNAGKADWNSFVNEANIVVPEDELVIGTESDVLSVNHTSRFIDDNTIIVLDKSHSFKRTDKFQASDSQWYAKTQNMYYYKHIWYNISALPQGKGFKFSAKDLNVNPNNAIVGGK